MSGCEGGEETMMKHIAELRAAILRCFAGASLAFCVTAYFSREIYRLLSLPLKQLLPEGSHFITIHPVEAWYTYVKTAAFSAVFLASPVIFREVWAFLKPGLRKGERRTLAAFVVSSSVFFIGGALFGYFVAFPSGFGYFTSVLEDTDILFMPRMEDYLGFAFQMLIAFGIIAETPLLMYFLAAAGVASHAAMRAFRRYYVLVAAVIAAILTPPDIVSQILMGVPMVLLYEVGLSLAWIAERRRSRAVAAEGAL